VEDELELGICGGIRYIYYVYVLEICMTIRKTTRVD
jgi:hypothetical protein